MNKMLLDSLFMMRGLSSKLHFDMVINMPSNGIKMAVAIMGVIPIMLVYPFLQKYFIKGIVIGAVKG